MTCWEIATSGGGGHLQPEAEELGQGNSKMLQSGLLGKGCDGRRWDAGTSGRSRARETALPMLLPPGLLPGPQHSCVPARLQLLPELLSSLSLRSGLVREPLQAQNPHSSGIFQNCPRQEDSSAAKGSEEPGISALFLDQASPGTWGLAGGALPFSWTAGP